MSHLNTAPETKAAGGDLRPEIAQGAGVDLVVHVGDVAYIGDVVRAVEMAQQPEQHIEDDDRARIADMGEVIDGRAADIHAHIVGLDRGKILLRARQRIVEPESLEPFRHAFPSGALDDGHGPP